MAVYLAAIEVGRPPPDSQALARVLRERVRYKQRRAMSKLHRLARTSRLTLPLWLGDNRGQTSALKRSVVA